MEDDLNFFERVRRQDFFLKLEDDLNFLENGKLPQLEIGRRKQFFESGRVPNLKKMNNHTF